MRQADSNQLRLDIFPIAEVELSLQCRDRIVPVLRALQHVYCDGELPAKILRLIGEDINKDSRTNARRKGMDYWGMCVLLADEHGIDG